MWLRSCCGYEGRQTRRSFNQPTGQMGRQTHTQIIPGRTTSTKDSKDRKASPSPSRPTPPKDALTLPFFLPQARSLHAATKKKKKKRSQVLQLRPSTPKQMSIREKKEIKSTVQCVRISLLLLLLSSFSRVRLV